MNPKKVEFTEDEIIILNLWDKYVEELTSGVHDTDKDLTKRYCEFSRLSPDSQYSRIFLSFLGGVGAGLELGRALFGPADQQ